MGFSRFAIWKNPPSRRKTFLSEDELVNFARSNFIESYNQIFDAVQAIFFRPHTVNRIASTVILTSACADRNIYSPRTRRQIRRVDIPTRRELSGVRVKLEMIIIIIICRFCLALFCLNNNRLDARYGVPS